MCVCVYIYIYMHVHEIFVKGQGQSEREKWTAYFSLSAPKYYQNILFYCLFKHWQIT